MGIIRFVKSIIETQRPKQTKRPRKVQLEADKASYGAEQRYSHASKYLWQLEKEA